jgi:hypothetical protein
VVETDKENQKSLKLLLNHVAREPTASDLWKLRGVLLACTQGRETDSQLEEIAREFFLYLSELQSKMTARQYNEFASRLDIGSVGMLALQDILVEHTNLWKNLLLGGIGEGLMVLASRQYIKAWEHELKSVHRRAAWVLYGALWRMSRQYQPEMPVQDRQRLIETTLAPAMDDTKTSENQMLLLVRLFQTLLLLLALPLCTPE